MTHKTDPHPQPEGQTTGAEPVPDYVIPMLYTALHAERPATAAQR